MKLNCFLVLNAHFRLDSPSCLRSKLTAKLSLPPTPPFCTMNKLEVNEVGAGFPHRDRTWNYCCVAARPAELLACVLREGGKFARLPLESSHNSLGRMGKWPAVEPLHPSSSGNWHKCKLSGPRRNEAGFALPVVSTDYKTLCGWTLAGRYDKGVSFLP